MIVTVVGLVGGGLVVLLDLTKKRVILYCFL